MSKYKVGDKFVVEIEDVKEYSKQGHAFPLYRIKGFSTLVFDDYGLDMLGQLVQGVDTFSHNKGMEEAWALAQKVYRSDYAGGYSCEELADIFGDRAIHDEYFGTVHEVKAKIEAWEEKKNEIRVGDVIKVGCEKCVVTVADGGTIYFLKRNGGFGWISDASIYTKTGEHVDLDGLFKQIGE